MLLYGLVASLAIFHHTTSVKAIASGGQVKSINNSDTAPANTSERYDEAESFSLEDWVDVENE